MTQRPLVLVSLLALSAAVLPGPVAAQVRADDPDVVVNLGGEDASSRQIVLPLGKAAIVDLPRAAADVLVSDPDVVDPVIRTPRRIYIMGREPGQANAFFFDSENRQILNLEIRVEQDAEAIKTLIAKLMPDTRVEVESLNGNVILHGHVDTPGDAQRAQDIAQRFAGAENTVNMLKVREPAQVMVRVRIVEMQRRLIRQLGVDVTGVAQIEDSAVSFAVQNSFAISGSALGGISGDVSTPGFGDVNNLDFAFDVFEQNGLVKTLAEPNLTALSGEAARFLAGGEFPVPEASATGVPSVSFKEFGVGLDFTPTVYDKGRIRLKLRTEVSELAPTSGLSFGASQTIDENGNPVESEGFVVPGVTSREAETTVEMPSGGSFAIAGLLQENITDFVDGVPGIKDTPVLGALFRSQEFQNEQTELVVIVTPYIVQPTHLSKLTDPARGHISPAPVQSILLGRLEAAYGIKGNQAAETSLQGPVGFILD